jgi:gluconolactonase
MSANLPTHFLYPSALSACGLLHRNVRHICNAYPLPSMSFFEPPQLIQAEVFAAVPKKLRKKGDPSTWIDANHPGSGLDCFLEGPAFDRDGNLYVVDIPYGRILQMSPEGELDVAAQYDGWPNGLAIHRDGRIFIADYRLGIMVLDPKSGRVEPFLTHAFSESFKGVNDLTFGKNGDLYFTDQGQTGVQDPTGRVYRYTRDGRLECLISNGPSPNGLVLDPDDKVLFVAMTRSNCMWHCPRQKRWGSREGWRVRAASWNSWARWACDG